ncbi:MAG: methyltransferase domain-containing protein, partial [Clostridia bacterium]
MQLKCPICNNPLIKSQKQYVCINKHSYDISKEGYVNLLMSQQSNSRNHGDNAEMIKARHQFLQKGYYQPLREKLAEIALKLLHNNEVMLDAGCGEFWYTEFIINKFIENNLNIDVIGADISKDALQYSAKRQHNSALVVASNNKLPLMNDSCDLVLNIFAPIYKDEMLRIIKSGGHILNVSPLENHLMSLKNIIYDNPYINAIDKWQCDGFIETENIEVKNKITVVGNDIMNLFKMTPYYHKTSQQDKNKLIPLESLEIET